MKVNYNMDEILEARKAIFREKSKRGLMKYYDAKDSVNSKVSKYVFTVEKLEKK